MFLYGRHRRGPSSSCTPWAPAPAPPAALSALGSSTGARRRGARSTLCVSSVSASFYLCQATVKGGAAAELGQAVAGQRVDVALVRRAIAPPRGRRADHAGAHPLIHAGD